MLIENRIESVANASVGDELMRKDGTPIVLTQADIDWAKTQVPTAKKEEAPKLGDKETAAAIGDATIKDPNWIANAKPKTMTPEIKSQLPKDFPTPEKMTAALSKETDKSKKEQEAEQADMYRKVRAANYEATKEKETPKEEASKDNPAPFQKKEKEDTDTDTDTQAQITDVVEGATKENGLSKVPVDNDKPHITEATASTGESHKEGEVGVNIEGKQTTSGKDKYYVFRSGRWQYSPSLTRKMTKANDEKMGTQNNIKSAISRRF